jgi:hypothetical protein
MATIAERPVHCGAPAEDYCPTSILGPDRDRRRHPRLQLALQLRLYRSGEEAGVEAQMQNISSGGFYCTSEYPFSPHEIFDCELGIPGLGYPPDIDLVVDCRVRVVRIDQNGLDVFGAACQIKEYTVSRIGRWPAGTD